MPLDISVFVALKKKSAKIRRIYYDELKNYSDQVVPLTMMMVEATFSKRTITRGFIEAGYIRKNDTGEAIPQVFVEALLKHMTPLADLRKEMMEAGKDATSEHPVLVPEAGEALLDSRLKSLKLEKLRRMYDTCFRKGKSSIPKRSACVVSWSTRFVTTWRRVPSRTTSGQLRPGISHVPVRAHFSEAV